MPARLQQHIFSFHPLVHQTGCFPIREIVHQPLHLGECRFPLRYKKKTRCLPEEEFLNDEKDKAFSSKVDPDCFVKYGKYEMRIRDKILVENGYITKAKVRWYGGGFAYPYLWKEKKSDLEYKESWSDPRISKLHRTKSKTKDQIQNGQKSISQRGPKLA